MASIFFSFTFPFCLRVFFFKFVFFMQFMEFKMRVKVIIRTKDFLKNFIFTSDYSYYKYKNTFENSNNKTNNTYSFLNANLYYQQKDSKWEFKISANNLTNNTSMNTDSYNEISDSNSTSIYYVQPRLYMFSVKYNL